MSGDLILSADVANRVATYDAKIAQGQSAPARPRAGESISGRRRNMKSRWRPIASNLQKVQNRRLMRTDLNLAAQVKGSGIKLDDADAAARIDVKRSVLGPAKIDSGAVRASIARGLVRIAQASIVRRRYQPQREGPGGARRQQRGDLSYDLQSDDLAPWMTLAGQQRRRQGAGHRSRERSLRCADGEWQRLDDRAPDRGHLDRRRQSHLCARSESATTVCTGASMRASTRSTPTSI